MGLEETCVFATFKTNVGGREVMVCCPSCASDIEAAAPRPVEAAPAPKKTGKKAPRKAARKATKPARKAGKAARKAPRKAKRGGKARKPARKPARRKRR
jgi:hypothetical protein